MTLLLRMQRCPAGVAAETREVTRAPFSIGRGSESDWTLLDPGRVLSKRHCEITVQDNGWLVTDTSSNGTFLNGACLDPGVPRAFQAGDRLAFGAYELEARLRDDDAPALEERLTGDPFPAGGDPIQAAVPSIGLPGNFDPLSAGESLHPDPVSDHASDLDEHFRPPRPSFETLPHDWDSEASIVHPVASPTPLPEPKPVAAPVAVPVAAPTPPAGGEASLAAFAAGAGMAAAPAGDAETILRELGAAFRAMVSGLRRVMIARATIKGEFRIEQTVIRAVGNNPLKFSADDDDALASLVGTGRKGRMSPERAITEALRDMRLHELAVASAMQHAVRDLLAELDPSRPDETAPRTLLDRLSGRRERAALAAYAARHARMTRALGDDFDSVFGKSFMRAYETAMSEIAVHDAVPQDRSLDEGDRY